MDNRISAKPINIDIETVVRDRLGGASRLIPRFAIRKLEKLICQDRLNELLRHNFPKRGAEFCRGVLSDLNVDVRLINAERLPPADNRRVIIVSNHPLGGLDGMALIDVFTSRYGGRVMFVVNDLLMAVEPLAPVFLPINKHGRQSRASLVAIDAVMASDDPVIIFPAGLCSRQPSAGAPVADLQWQKMFVNKAVTFQRDVVPLYFAGNNSQRFYSFARCRQAMGIKFNFEMLLLPGEIFKSCNKTFLINCGRPIPWQSLQGGVEALAEASAIRRVSENLREELITSHN